MTRQFISFEGGDGSGKTTQIQLLEKSLKLHNLPVLLTREPGGSNLGEQLRKIFLEQQDLQPMSELLMNMTMRSEHIDKQIKPALANNKTVLCDRFVDSSAIYQGIIGQLGLEYVYELHKQLLGNFLPDITFVLDLDIDSAVDRVNLRDNARNRFDNASGSDFSNIRQGFLQVANLFPDRVKVINANNSSEDIHKQIISHINNKLQLELPKMS